MAGSTDRSEVENRPAWTRRQLVKTAGCIAATGAIAASIDPVAAQSGPDYGDWFEDVSNYDGTTVDQRGKDNVTISVGADGNSGTYAFDPPAVRVDPGTTVVFEWVSDTHNVLPEAVPDESSWKGHEPLEDTGMTYEHTFETEGIYTYYCDPHRSLGMKGAIVVGDQGASSGGAGGTSPTAFGLPGLLFGGLGIAAASFVVGLYVGGRRKDVDQRSAALFGLGAALIGSVFVIAVVTKLILGG